MALPILKLLSKKYPRNFILKNPYLGTLIFLLFCLGFVLIYRPLNLHESRFLGFGSTMAVYLGGAYVPIILLVRFLGIFRYFSNDKEWTILKEILSVVIILLGLGVFIYFTGFLAEIPVNRWNLFTVLDSIGHAFLIGIFPLGVFSAVNYRHLYTEDSLPNVKLENKSGLNSQQEELIQIGSRLKNEELSFFPSQFLYLESDGNYVVFYLKVNNQVKKEVIRNSISNLEQQLSVIPFILRTHRAFIVNLTKVSSKKGNTLGYRLKLIDVDGEIPVSRQNTRRFNQLLKEYR